MQTYTVYEKRVAPESIDERATDLVFVKEGFAFWALIFPGIWFLFNRLWRGFFLYLLLTIGLVVALAMLGLNDEVITWASAALNLLFALEARDIQRAALERDDYVLKGVVSGRNLDECERRFLMEWLPDARRGRDRMAAMAAGSGRSDTGIPTGAAQVPLIGMFPSHGG